MALSGRRMRPYCPLKLAICSSKTSLREPPQRREIAESCGDCGKTSVNEFLKRFRECQELSYPLPENITNESIESLLYKKPGVSKDSFLYRDFNKESVYKALARKGETLKHLWQKYNAIG